MREYRDRLIADHASGAQEGGDAIWSLMNLELWYRTFIDGLGTQTLDVPSTRVARSGQAPVRVSA